MCELNECECFSFVLFIFGMTDSEIGSDGVMSGSLQEVGVIIGSPSSSPSPSDLHIWGLQGLIRQAW